MRHGVELLSCCFLRPQLVCHLVESYSAESSANGVDGDPVPVGFLLSLSQWHVRENISKQMPPTAIGKLHRDARQ